MAFQYLITLIKSALKLSNKISEKNPFKPAGLKLFSELIPLKLSSSLFCKITARYDKIVLTSLFVSKLAEVLAQKRPFVPRGWFFPLLG